MESAPDGRRVDWDECQTALCRLEAALTAYEAVTRKHGNALAAWAAKQAKTPYHGWNIESETYSNKEAVRCSIAAMWRMLSQSYAQMQRFERKMHSVTGLSKGSKEGAEEKK